MWQVDLTKKVTFTLWAGFISIYILRESNTYIHICISSHIHMQRETETYSVGKHQNILEEEKVEDVSMS